MEIEFSSHYETTVAFLVNKLFYITTRLLYIQKTYIHFLKKHLHTFAFLYFEVKSISQNTQETTCAGASFLLKLREIKDFSTAVPVNFVKFLRTLLVEHLQVTVYLVHGVRL